MSGAVAIASACLLAFLGSPCAQNSESYSECMKRVPEAGMYRVGATVLQRMARSESLPRASELPKDKDAEVDVAILIDQHGLVVCAAAFSGDPAFVEASVKAARQWKFKPSVLDGRPIVVSGNLYFHYSKGKVVAGFAPYQKPRPEGDKSRLGPLP
jgi:hypothetical protein